VGHATPPPPICPRTGAACPAPSERKRELERKRRELISERLLELEAAVGLRPSDADRAGKRIDKEAVLKAALGLVRGHKDSLAGMTATADRALREAAELRAEKAELRADKAYLRRELDTVREEARRLRADNIALWKTCRAVGAVGNPKLSHLLGPATGGAGMVAAAPAASGGVGDMSRAPGGIGGGAAPGPLGGDAAAAAAVNGGVAPMVSADVAAAATAAIDGLFTGRFAGAGVGGGAGGGGGLDDPAAAVAAADAIAQFFKDDMVPAELGLDANDAHMGADVAHCP